MRAVALLLLCGFAAAAAPIGVEHSLDGGHTYVSAGAITIHPSRYGSTAVLERDALPAGQAAQLRDLLAGGGLYRLRLAVAPVATSFPARCLAAAAAPGGLELELVEGSATGSGGRQPHIAGIAVSAPCTRSTNVGADANPAHLLPESQDLRVRLPVAAPDVLPLLPPPGQAGPAGGSVPLDAGMQAGQQRGSGGPAGQQPAQGEAGSAGDKGEADRKAAQEEKTWLQKNWMMAMPLVFIALNIVGNVAGGGQQPAAAPGRSGGGAAAPVRVARR